MTTAQRIQRCTILAEEAQKLAATADDMPPTAKMAITSRVNANLQYLEEVPGQRREDGGQAGGKVDAGGIRLGRFRILSRLTSQRES
jgi:hypothetical protein